MRISILVLFLLCPIQLNGELRALSFDQILPGNAVSDLLKIAAEVYGSLGEDVSLDDLSKKLLDFIGGIYVLKYQKKIGMQANFLHDDLNYLADLFFDIQNKFRVKYSALKSEQALFINNLFLQIQIFLRDILNRSLKN